MQPIDWSKLQRFHRFGGASAIITWGLFVAFGLLFGVIGMAASQRALIRCIETDDCNVAEAGVFFCGLVLIGITLLAPFAWAIMVPRFIKVMKGRAHEVVWLYPKSLRRGGYVVTSLVIGLQNGRSLELDIARGVAAHPPFVEDLLRRMAMLVPHATIGFSGVNEARFAQNPQALRRA